MSAGECGRYIIGPDGIPYGPFEPAREAPKDPVDIGQVAYEAYCDYVGWQSVHGDDLPRFSEQLPRVQNAWRVAAEAVARVREAAP